MQGSRGAEPDRSLSGGLDLYLVRHAVAHERDPGRWPDDRLRPLTRKGVEDFRCVARALGELESRVGAVLSSPLARAWQTAGLLESEGRWPAPEELPELGPETPASGILSALAARGDLQRMGAVALVGHRPSLHELASYMVCGDPHGVEVGIKKGGVAVVRFGDGIGPGSGVLLGLLAPDLLLPGGQAGL